MTMKLQKLPCRIIIYPKDVVNITGRSEQTARRIIRKVRQAFGKSPDDFVTIQEFCAVYGIDEKFVREFLKD